MAIRPPQGSGKRASSVAGIPEADGGLGLPLSDGMLVAEVGAKLASFTTSTMCQTGIGSLPIVYFGTPEQKQRYLPKLASGEWLRAYALTEAQSGSDALGARTTAIKSDDGKSWILNGSKVLITNAGFADVFAVEAAMLKVYGSEAQSRVVDEGVQLHGGYGFIEEYAVCGAYRDARIT